MPPVPVSNSAADRAGDRWRSYVELLRTIRDADEPADLARERRRSLNQAVESIETISAYRALHAKPMDRTTMGIRSMVRTSRGGDDTIRPGQRFKRLDRIVNKLERYPKMRLSQMEDIGGCRVILPTTAAVYEVMKRIHHNWGEEARISDYIAEPKSDGYRGIHIVHKRAGRLVEVQLRTQRQHGWAETVEIFGPRVGYRLKDGEGPADLREYFERAAGRLAEQDAGRPLDPGAESAFATLREQVTPYFTRPSKL